MSKYNLSVLVRCKNESEWLPFLFDSLKAQQKIYLQTVLVLDNQSYDSPRSLCNLYPSLPLKFCDYHNAYLPGEMLNHGINLLLNDSDPGYILIISAHCFLKSSHSVYNLIDAIASTDKYRCAYGRQIPMSNSDSQAIRDLSLIYTKEPKIINSAASFNNAFSVIKSLAFSDHLFDPKVANLEDMIWAHDEIQLGYGIQYVPSAEAVHYHGPHHSNSLSRLKSTEATIRSFKDVFNIELVEPFISEEYIAQLFFGVPSYKFLISNESLVTSLHYVVHSEDEFADLLRLDVNESQIFVVESSEENSLYSLLPLLYSRVLTALPHILYFVIYDNSYDPQFPVIYLSQAANLLRKRFANAIWPVAESKHIPFDSDMKIFENEKFSSLLNNKLLRFESRRGNGLIVTRKVFLNPKLIFQSYSAFCITPS